MNKFFIIFIFLLSTFGHSWDGYDYTTGNYIDIESYDHGGRGEGEVEFYDYGTGTYKSGYLDMHPGGSGTLYDYETGEYRDVDMD
jgi:hypothetical protein